MLSHIRVAYDNHVNRGGHERRAIADLFALIVLGAVVLAAAKAESRRRTISNRLYPFIHDRETNFDNVRLSSSPVAHNVAKVATPFGSPILLGLGVLILGSRAHKML